MLLPFKNLSVQLFKKALLSVIDNITIIINKTIKY
jgi:hypothetical protein